MEEAVVYPVFITLAVVDCVSSGPMQMCLLPRARCGRQVARLIAVTSHTLTRNVASYTQKCVRVRIQ